MISHQYGFTWVVKHWFCQRIIEVYCSINWFTVLNKMVLIAASQGSVATVSSARYRSHLSSGLTSYVVSHRFYGQALSHFNRYMQSNYQITWYWIRTLIILTGDGMAGITSLCRMLLSAPGLQVDHNTRFSWKVNEGSTVIPKYPYLFTSNGRKIHPLSLLSLIYEFQ